MSGVSDLRFDPPPECDRPGCCDLSCVWERIDERVKAREAMRAAVPASVLAERLSDAASLVFEHGGVAFTLPDGSTLTVSWDARSLHARAPTSCRGGGCRPMEPPQGRPWWSCRPPLSPSGPSDSRSGSGRCWPSTCSPD